MVSDLELTIRIICEYSPCSFADIKALGMEFVDCRVLHYYFLMDDSLYVFIPYEDTELYEFHYAIPLMELS